MTEARPASRSFRQWLSLPQAAHAALIPICALFFAALTTLSLLRHNCLESGEDLAMFDQMLWSVREGRGLITTISGNPQLQFPHHFFGEHFAPILYPLAPLAGLTSGPEALLILQALVVALSAIPLALLIGNLTNSRWLGAAVALLWLAQCGIWEATLYDFHMESFQPLCLFAFALAFQRGRMVSAWLWAGLYAACKEDAAVYIAFAAGCIGCFSAHRRQALTMAAVFFLYALLAWFVVEPAFSPRGQRLLEHRVLLPHSPGDFLPWVQNVAFDLPRWRNLLIHLASFGMLPLFGGLAVLPFMASVGIAWLGRSDNQSQIMLHYPYSVYPLAMLASAMALKRLLAARRTMIRVWPASFAARACIPLAVWAAGTLFAWNIRAPEMRGELGATGWARCVRLRDARAVLARLPADESVASALTLSPHIARRTNVALILNGIDSDCYAMRIDRDPYPVRGANFRAWMRSLLGPASEYGVLAAGSDAVVVLKRGHPNYLNAQILDVFTSVFCAVNLMHLTGRPVSDAKAVHGEAWQVSPRDKNGYAVYGPYEEYPAGLYRVTFRLRRDGPPDKAFAFIEVSEDNGRAVRGHIDLRGTSRTYEDIPVDVTLTGMGGVEFRCIKTRRKGTVWLDQIVIKPLEHAEPAQHGSRSG